MFVYLAQRVQAPLLHALLPSRTYAALVLSVLISTSLSSERLEHIMLAGGGLRPVLSFAAHEAIELEATGIRTPFVEEDVPCSPTCGLSSLSAC